MLSYTLRTLLKNPGFTAVAVLTLALGIAANTAIFSAVDAVLLHPLSFPHSEQLVTVTKTMPMFELFQSISSPLDFLDYRSQSKAFSGMAAIGYGQYNLTGNRLPERVPGIRVSPGLFPMLGANPILGRAFLPEEEHWGNHKVVLLTETFWRSHFNADRSLVGKQIELDGEKYTVVGVVRPMLRFMTSAELWLPLAFPPNELGPNDRGHQYLDVLARLKPGTSLAQAQTDLTRVAADMTRQIPGWYPKGWSLEARPLDTLIAGPVRTPLLVLLGAVALVLLIGCANVANLLLARAAARQKEITIRAALGASRLVIVRQLLAESAVIALTAGALGFLAAVWILDAFERFGPAGLLQGQHAGVNLSIGAFTLLVSLLATLFFGLAPAIAASHTDLNDSLKENSRGASGTAGKQRMRSALIAFEVALSLTLLISAGLLIRSFQSLEQSNPGFDARDLATFQLSLPAVRYRQPQQLAIFYTQLLERMSTLPGVTSAAAVDPLPFAHSNRGGSFKIVGREWDPSKPKPDVAYRRASAGFFKTMRIPVLRGREFSNRDEFGAPKVAVVDEPFVKQFFPNQDPIGKQLGDGFGGAGPEPFTIVGVVGGTKSQHMSDAPQPTIYYPGMQAPFPAITIVMRTRGGDPLRLISAARQTVASLDHDLPIYRPATMEARLEDSLARTRFSTTLLTVFAGLALLLAAFGIYGVISYIVGQRSHEIGVRMALGARPRDAVALVLRQAMTPLAAGIAAGLIASLAATRSLSSLLYGVKAFDPLTYLAVSLFLAAVALLASYVPAMRATKVDPMVALRYE